MASDIKRRNHKRLHISSLPFRLKSGIKLGRHNSKEGLAQQMPYLFQRRKTFLMTKHRKKRLEAHVNVSFLKFTFLSLISNGILVYLRHSYQPFFCSNKLCSVNRGILVSENTRRRKIERPVIEKKREERFPLFKGIPCCPLRT